MNAITPESIVAKSGSEDSHQMALFLWSHLAERFGRFCADNMNSYESEQYCIDMYGEDDAIPPLALMYAIPNGGKRDIRTAVKLKATGVKKGVPDINLDVPVGRYHGLRIELKKPKLGKISKEQSEFMERLQQQGFRCEVCYGWLEARDVIVNYLGV